VEYNNKPYKLHLYEMIHHSLSWNNDIMPIGKGGVIPWQEARKISYSEIREVFKKL